MMYISDNSKTWVKTGVDLAVAAEEIREESKKVKGVKYTPSTLIVESDYDKVGTIIDVWV